MKKIFLSEMTWEEAEKNLRKSDVVIVPTGSTEQHGPHLPVLTDSIISQRVSEKVAERASEKGVRVVVTPPLYFGFSQEHMEYPGTIALSSETFTSVLYEICRSLIAHGAKRILIINGHGGNIGCIDTVSRKIGRDFGVFVFYTFPYAREVVAKVCPDEIGTHAEEVETSLVMAIRPELVKIDRAVKEIPPLFRQLGFTVSPQAAKKDISFGWFRTRKTLTRRGIIGNPTQASPDKGREIMEKSIDIFVNFLVGIKKLARKGYLRNP